LKGIQLLLEIAVDTAALAGNWRRADLEEFLTMCWCIAFAAEPPHTHQMWQKMTIPFGTLRHCNVRCAAVTSHSGDRSTRFV
jgi:hypothetical protein